MTFENEDTIKLAVIFDEPLAWKILAVWAISLKARDCSPSDALHVSRLQNLTGGAVKDCERWAKILVSCELAYGDGQIEPVADAFIRAKMVREVEAQG